MKIYEDELNSYGSLHIFSCIVWGTNKSLNKANCNTDGCRIVDETTEDAHQMQESWWFIIDGLR